MESGSQLLYLTHTAPHSRVRACGDDFLVLILLSSWSRLILCFLKLGRYGSSNKVVLFLGVHSVKPMTILCLGCTSACSVFDIEVRWSPMLPAPVDHII